MDGPGTEWEYWKWEWEWEWEYWGECGWMDNGWNIVVKRAGERSKEREGLTFCLLDGLRG
jgi:hypothetical protein